MNKSNRISPMRTDMVPLLRDLRWTAENVNRIPGMDPGTLLTAKQDGWEFGYRVVDHGVFFRRRIYVKNLESRFSEIPPHEKDPVMEAVFEVFLDKGMPGIEILQVSPDCVKIEQDFIPLLLNKTDTARTHIRVNDNDLLALGKLVN